MSKLHIMAIYIMLLVILVAWIWRRSRTAKKVHEVRDDRWERYEHWRDEQNCYSCGRNYAISKQAGLHFVSEDLCEECWRKGAGVRPTENQKERDSIARGDHLP